MIRLTPGGFQSPVETTISSQKSRKRKRILNSKQRGMVANQFLYLLSTKEYRKKKGQSLNCARGRNLTEETEL